MNMFFDQKTNFPSKYTVTTMQHESARLLKDKFLEFRANHAQKGMVKTAYLFFFKILSSIVRILAAKVYLRNCTKIGALVTVNGKPLIKAKGKIILGDKVAIWSVFDRTKLFVHEGSELIIGNSSRINGVHISVKRRVHIGNFVRIGPYSLIMDSDFHNVYDHENDGKVMSVEIGDHVWIASKVTILKGVKIGEGAMVAAGSVVTKDVPPYTMVAGVPARVIRHLNKTVELKE